MFGTLIVGGILVAASTLVVMQWKRAKSDELRRAGLSPSNPNKTGPGAVFDTRVQSGGRAHHIVDLGRFGRGLDMNRRTAAGQLTPHWGMDITAPSLTPVRAALDGRVVSINPIEGYGNAVVLSHPQLRQSTVYAHLTRAMVSVGQQVGGGDVVGLVGRSCSVPGQPVPSWCPGMGSHLHFEVHPAPTPTFAVSYRRLDPVRWLREKNIEMFAWELPRAFDTTLQNFGDL